MFSSPLSQLRELAHPKKSSFLREFAFSTLFLVALMLPSLPLLTSQPQLTEKVPPPSHLRARDTPHPHLSGIRWILPLKCTAMVNSDLKMCRDVITKRKKREMLKIDKYSYKSGLGAWELITQDVLMGIHGPGAVKYWMNPRQK